MDSELHHATARGQLLIFREDESKLEDSFWRFHHENPHVYATLVRLAREWRARRPGTRCGMKMLYEVTRWKLSLSTQGEPLRLNNNYHAFYARLIMEREADLARIFETRRQRFDVTPE